MADPVQEKVQKCFESRLKAETELKKFQKDIVDAVDNSERRVRVERLVEYCNAAMTKAFARNEQLLELAKKCNDPTTITGDLEKWLNDVTVENDEIPKKARDYIDKCPQLDMSSQSSHRTTTVKSISSKATSSKVSKTSSQRQRDLIIAQQRREEIEKQNEAIIRLAKQKQQLEIEQQELQLQRLRKEQALRVKELEEENRRKLAEATLAEMELREDLSDSNLDFHETLSLLSATSKGNGTERINEWVNNSPNGAKANLPTNEVPTTAASTSPFGIQIPPQQVQIAGTQVTNAAVATNSDPSAAFVPTLSPHCQFSTLQTLIKRRLFDLQILLPLRLLSLPRQRFSQRYRNRFLRLPPKQQLFKVKLCCILLLYR